MDKCFQGYNFSVGHQVPIPNPIPGKESYLLTVVDSSLNILIYFPGLLDEEIKVFNNNRLIYGIYVDENIPYILVKFLESNLCFCFSVNLFVMDPDHRSRALTNGIDKVSLFLTDDDNHILKGIHHLHLGLPAKTTLNTTLASQSQMNRDRDEINTIISKVFSKYSNEELLKMVISYLPTPIK